MNCFAQPFQSWDEVFRLIQSSALGRQTLNRFFLRRNPVRIEFYPEEVRPRLVAALTPKSPLGAVFVTDGEQGTIYVDDQSQLGILVPFLFHEMIHSLDGTLWKAARQTLSPSQRNTVIYEAECRAFRAQHLFQEELKELHPELRSFHETQYSHLSFLNRALLPHEIASLYCNSKL